MNGHTVTGAAVATIRSAFCGSACQYALGLLLRQCERERSIGNRPAASSAGRIPVRFITDLTSCADVPFEHAARRLEDARLNGEVSDALLEGHYESHAGFVKQYGSSSTIAKAESSRSLCAARALIEITRREWRI